VKNRGYALIETLFATVLLVSGLVHLATLFSFTEGISVRNRQRTLATLFVYNKMEQLQEVPSPFGGSLDPLRPEPGFMDTPSVDNSPPPSAYLRLWEVQSADPHRTTIVVFARIGTSSHLELARATAFLARR